MRTYRRILAASLGLVAAAAVAACAPRGDDVRDARDPDAVGTITSVDDAPDGLALGFAPDPGYEYFEGTVFAFTSAGALEGPEGEPVTAADVEPGDRIEVWVEACAESFPVQCADPVGRLLP